jgi:hypothetical protein
VLDILNFLANHLRLSIIVTVSVIAVLLAYGFWPVGDDEDGAGE